MMSQNGVRQPLSVLAVPNPNTHVTAQPGLHTDAPQKKRQYDQNQKYTLREGRPSIAAYRIGNENVIAGGRNHVKRIKTEGPTATAQDLATARYRAHLEAEQKQKLKIWQAAYRKEFPSLHFYFDACPTDDVRRCTRKINFLGGTVEQFFSNAVTVVVTTRDIGNLSIPHTKDSTNRAATMQRTSQLAGRLGVKLHETPGRPNLPQHDVLVKAQNLKMKIWTLKKLQSSVLKNLISEHTQPANERSLSTTLHTEKFVGHSEENVGHFRGPYLLVRDMDEQHRPVMCREWPNVASEKDGEWPQWRSTRSGRCPFVRDRKAEALKMAARSQYSQPVQRVPFDTLQHANASGIHQVTSAIQSHIGRPWQNRENLDASVTSLLKKAITAKRSFVVSNNAQIDSADVQRPKTELKAGFCENCKDKFDDFDSHLQTKTHKAYAKNEENFAELDDLLRELERGPAFYEPGSDCPPSDYGDGSSMDRTVFEA